MRILLLALACIAPILAEEPVVTAVVDQLTGGPSLSPGGRAVIYFTPSSFNATAITVGGWPAKVVAITTGSPVYVMLPREVSQGCAPLVLSTSDGESAPFDILLEPLSPALVLPPAPYCQAAQSLGVHFYLYATGLGPTDPPLPTPEVPGPSRPTTNTPRVTVAGVDAEVISSVLLPTTYGVYVVAANLGPGTPDGVQPVVLTIGEKTSNTVNLLVGMTTELATNFGASVSRGAPEAIMTATRCSEPLAIDTVTADGSNPPTSLAGTTVKVKDSAGTERLAALHYVSPSQVNYVIPTGTANGPATVTITSASGAVSTAPLNVDTVEPGVFGSYLVRVRDGAQRIEPVGPDNVIDLGPATDQVYLVVTATGLRKRTSIDNVHVTARGPSGDVVEMQVEYAGPQSSFAGLDQVNVLVPKSAASFGLCDEYADVSVVVDGKGAFVGQFLFK